MVSGEIISQAPGQINNLWTVVFFLAMLWTGTVYLLNKRIEEIKQLRIDNNILTQANEYYLRRLKDLSLESCTKHLNSLII